MPKTSGNASKGRIWVLRAWKAAPWRGGAGGSKPAPHPPRSAPCWLPVAGSLRQELEMPLEDPALQFLNPGGGLPFPPGPTAVSREGWFCGEF